MSRGRGKGGERQARAAKVTIKGGWARVHRHWLVVLVVDGGEPQRHQAAKTRGKQHGGGWEGGGSASKQMREMNVANIAILAMGTECFQYLRTISQSSSRPICIVRMKGRIRRKGTTTNDEHEEHEADVGNDVERVERANDFVSHLQQSKISQEENTE